MSGPIVSPLPDSKTSAARGFAWTLVFLALWLGVVAGSITLCGTGFIHPETHSFLPHYLSGRPFLELVFDNRITEWGNYQARELAFVIDYLDCQLIAWSAAHGHPHLFAASHYLMLLVSGFALWRICARYLGLDHIISLGLVLLLWTAPTAIFYTSFYRSAKVAVLTASLCAMWAWFSAATPRPDGRGTPFWKYPLFAMAALSMPMVDKMGLAFLCMFCGFLAWRWFSTRTRTDFTLLVSGAVALGAAIIHGWWVGPALTIALNHYPAENGYSSLPVGELIHSPKRLALVVIGGMLFTVDSFRFVLGNLPAGLALGAAAAIWWLLPRDLDRSGGGLRSLLAPAWVFVVGCLAIFGLYMVMLLRFESMLSTEHRRVFYNYPVAGFWLVLVAIALHYAVSRWGARGVWWARATVLLCVVSSLYAVQEHRFIARHGKYEPFYQNAANCFAALRPEALAAAPTQVEAEALLATTPLPGDGLISDVRQDRIYLALLARIPRR